jgi:hypothetical protein
MNTICKVSSYFATQHLNVLGCREVSKTSPSFSSYHGGQLVEMKHKKPVFRRPKIFPRQVGKSSAVLQLSDRQCFGSKRRLAGSDADVARFRPRADVDEGVRVRCRRISPFRFISDRELVTFQELLDQKISIAFLLTTIHRLIWRQTPTFILARLFRFINTNNFSISKNAIGYF